LLDSVLRVSFAVEHLTVNWNDITERESRGLQILWEERENRRRELQK
jgi:hypothetical protein